MNMMIPPIPAGTFVGVQNCVGAYRIIRRGAPNFYYVNFKGTEVLMPRRNLIHPLPPGCYMVSGGFEEFVTVQ